METPEAASVLDASILHIHPQGRDVSIEISGSNVVFHFPLLNSGEFFIAKILLQGTPSPGQFKFTISADDLPPFLKPRFLTPDLIESSEKREFEPVMLVGGLVVLLIGASIAGLIYPHLPVVFQMWSVGFAETFKANWLILVSSAISMIPALLLLRIGPMIIIGAFTNFSLPRRTRFRVPSDYIRHPFGRRSEVDYYAGTADGGSEPGYRSPDPKGRPKDDG
jgi:hypothetical protein